MKWLAFVALLASACGGSPTGPTPAAAAPVVVSTIQVSPCPSLGPFDLGFYQQIGCNGFERPMQSVRRWMVAPKLYIRTVDEAGTPIDAVTLDTVQRAMTEVAPQWTGGHFGLASVERGAASREGVSGWITVKWPAPNPADYLCGLAQGGVDGGWIELHYAAVNCAGCNGSRVRPNIAKHELGHALGYYHTDASSTDIMCQETLSPCDQQPSARELQAAAFQYR